MNIGLLEIQAAYSVSKSVYEKTMAKEAGASLLHVKYGMNLGSALDYIKAFRCLVDGEKFTRTINAPAADYFFSKILEDFGAKKLDVALQSMGRHIEYFEGASKSKVYELRNVVAKYNAQLRIKYLETYQDQLAERVLTAYRDSPEKRATRLKKAPEFPTKITVLTEYYRRNADVIVEVLNRAAGVCELCKKPAPFLRKKNKDPYLEVHHKKQLADGGKDIVENAIAVCPNCHRKAHYGVDIAELIVPVE